MDLGVLQACMRAWRTHQEEQSEESAKRSRMFRAVKDVAEGEISIEELTVALNNAVRSRNLRLID